MMKRRILAGMGANSFGMAITILMQLASLPIFLHFWNLETYGKWLILSAIPGYLSMADVGMVTAAGNKMTMAMGKKDEVEANQIFQSAQAFMACICAIIAVIIIPIILLAPLPWFESMDQRTALAAMSLGVLIALFGGLSEAAFKATERYASGTMLGNYVRLGEWLGAILGLASDGSLAAVAIGGLLMRLLGCIVGMVLVNKTVRVLHWGVKFAHYAEVKAMIKPAISFMAFPLANAFSFQGITILVGAMLGPVAVALFNTYRTIARVAVQITAILSHALWPEFSRLFGEGAKQEIYKLYLKTIALGVLQALFLSGALYFLAPYLLKIWTHDAIRFDSNMMLLMLGYAAIAGFWHVPRVLLMATNQHSHLASWTLLAGLLSVGLSWILCHVFDLTGVIMAMILSELLIAMICIYLASQLYRVISTDISKKRNLNG